MRQTLFVFLLSKNNITNQHSQPHKPTFTNSETNIPITQHISRGPQMQQSVLFGDDLLCRPANADQAACQCVSVSVSPVEGLFRGAVGIGLSFDGVLKVGQPLQHLVGLGLLGGKDW